MSSPETPDAAFDQLIAAQGLSYVYTDEDKQLLQLNHAYDQFHAAAHRQPGRETCTDGELISIQGLRDFQRQALSARVERLYGGLTNLVLTHVDEAGECTVNGYVYDPLVAPRKQSRDIAAMTMTLNFMAAEVVLPNTLVIVLNRKFHEEL